MQEEILLYFKSVASPFLDRFFTYITMLGEQYFVIFVIAWIYWNYSKKDGFFMTYIFTFSILINSLAKDMARTKRPFQVIEGLNSVRVETAKGFSFPSGHTQGATTLFTTLAQVFKGKTTFAIAFLLSLMVALSRVYLRVHWPIDVIGGFLLAVLISFTFFPFLSKMYLDQARFFSLLLFTLAFYYLVLISLSIINQISNCNWVEIKYYLMICAISTGFFLGFILEEKRFPFSVETVLWKKIIRFVLGIGVCVGMMLGLQALADNMLFTFVGYFLIGAWIVCIFPLVGIWLNLFEKEKAITLK
jgi:membrane-associated phospholipid phosphatase